MGRLVRYLLMASVLVLGYLSASAWAPAVSASPPSVVIPPPLPASNITSDVGIRRHPVTGGVKPHRGTDYGVPSNTQVKIANGYTSVNYRPGSPSAGNYLVVNYECNVFTRLLHLNGYNPTPTPGPEPIAYVGSTGRSTGPHLHFELVVDGVKVDPVAAYGEDLCNPTIRQCLKTHAAALYSGAIPPGSNQDDCRSGTAPAYPDPTYTVASLPDSGSFMHGTATFSRPATPYTAPASPSISGGQQVNEGLPKGGPVRYETFPGPVQDLACDVDVLTMIRGRAAFEAHEDIVATEIVVHRPDSVMEYTCTDQFLAFTAEHAGEVFSETDDWENRTVPHSSTVGGNMTMNMRLDPFSLDMVLEDIVIQSLDSYINNQYPLFFLGDTTTINDSVSNAIGSAAYTCEKMFDIWQVAKCTNFADSRYFNIDRDGNPANDKDYGAPFYSFQDMINEGDPRVQYERCDDTGLFSADLAMTEDRFFQFSGIEPAFWDTGITNYSDYLSEMQAGNIYTIFGGSGAPPSGSDYILPDLVSDQVCDGLAPIRTGIKVVTVDNFNQSTETITEYDEHFCANPGCFYDYTNDKCVAGP